MTWGDVRAARSASSRSSSATGHQERRPRRDLRAEPRRVGERRARDPGGGRRDGPDLPGVDPGAGRLRRLAQRREGDLRRHAGAARPPPRRVELARQRRPHRAARRRARCGARARVAAREGRQRAGVRGGGCQAHHARPARAPSAPLATARIPLAFERTMDAHLARSASADALHERHLGQPEGRPAHAPQRRASTAATG